MLRHPNVGTCNGHLGVTDLFDATVPNE